MQSNFSMLREGAKQALIGVIGLVVGCAICLAIAALLIVIVEDIADGAEQDNDIDKAKAALALAQAQRERETIKNAVALAEKGQCVDNLAAARLAAKELKKPLVLWVGMTCETHKDVRNALPEAVHCHLPQYHGSNKARLVIPEPDGTEYKVETFDETTPIGVRKRMGLPVKEATIAKPRPKAIVIEED